MFFIPTLQVVRQVGRARQVLVINFPSLGRIQDSTAGR